MRTVAGCLLILGGLGILWICYHADELGLGQYGGYGEDHYRGALLGLAVAGAGLLLLITPGKGIRSPGKPRAGGRSVGRRR